MIGILDYGLGNIHAFANIYKRHNLSATVASSTGVLRKADKIILPGVGSFDWAMARLNASGLRGTLEEMVTGEHKPVLGICVGMQMMARRSDEGKSAGLGWIDADVKLFDRGRLAQKTHLPHMGWNDVEPCGGSSLFRNLELGSRFYFLHSYHVVPSDERIVLSRTDYGGPYASGVRSGNVFGVQFHPEKSHHWGIQLLKNFAEL